MIIIPIFAKKRTAGDGKTFYNYLSTITKKDGTEIKVQVKFRMSCGMPDAHSCPCMIGFEKKDGNIVVKEFDKEIQTDGGTETRHIVQNTLWLSAWTDCGEYVDTSLDDIAE